MWSYVFVIFAFISGIYCGNSGPVVTLGYGQYQGFPSQIRRLSLGFSNDTNGVTSFLGIPFAAPPTGTETLQH
jgi:hypothetical protein